jgi:excisionase family DNA binding protein
LEANEHKGRKVEQPEMFLMNATQVAKLMGVSVSWVRLKVLQQQIPFSKLGHLVRFEKSEIEAWLKHHRRHSRPKSPQADERDDQK